MDDNTEKVLLAVVTMIGSVTAAAISAFAAYLTMRARQELAGNTTTTNRTLQIVNSERDEMKKEIINLKKELGAVQVVLSQERVKHPAAERTADHVEKAIEAVKEASS